MSFELILPFFRPIEALLLDDTVSEIMGNPDGVWWIETRGQLACAEGVRFDPKALIAGLEVIANYLGKKLGEDTPLLNAQLPDGSRLAAVLPPVVRPAPAVRANLSPNQARSYVMPLMKRAGHGLIVVQWPSPDLPSNESPSPFSPPTSNVKDDATRLTKVLGLW